MIKKIALVTGANRGIGLEVVKQLATLGHTVYLGARSMENGIKARETLPQTLSVIPIELDVTNPQSMIRARETILGEHSRLDILVNNAGAIFDDESKSALEADPVAVLRTFETNTMGPFRLCQIFIPAMIQNNYGRIVNISSGMGQLSEMNGGYPGYRISKTALNAITRIFSYETKNYNILINSVCPGWVRTDMGGPNAERDVAHGAATPVWLATLKDGGSRGGFFRDKESIDW